MLPVIQFLLIMFIDNLAFIVFHQWCMEEEIFFNYQKGRTLGHHQINFLLYRPSQTYLIEMEKVIL